MRCVWSLTVVWLAVAVPVRSFSTTGFRRIVNRVSPRFSLSAEDAQRAESIKRVMAEETMDGNSMAMTAERMKNMSPKEMDDLISEVTNMPLEQKEQLKAMGMDPDQMILSMKMMRDNPAIMESAQKMMENMSPEELVESSRLAQEQMAKMTPEQMQAAAAQMAAASPSQVDQMVSSAQATVKSTEASTTTSGSSTSALDANVIDTMYRAAELMSQPPIGKVTFRAFASLGPIVAVSGEKATDLTKADLAGCWEDGALGANRVDRAGFERVWREVDDIFYNDLMDEARDPKSSDKRKEAAEARVRQLEEGSDGGTTSMTTNPISTPLSTPMSSPAVGENLTPEQMKIVNEQMKNMSDDDMNAMLDQMMNMGPAQEARLKQMGVDPGMMKKSLKMMQDNPMMMNAAKAMASKMTPEQMQKASQQAQKQMKNMSPEEIEKAMDNFK